jgi:hypothetical protein
VVWPSVGTVVSSASTARHRSDSPYTSRTMTYPRITSAGEAPVSSTAR